MPNLNEREKTLLKLVIKQEFFNPEEGMSQKSFHYSYDDIALWFGYLDLPPIGKHMNFDFLGYETGNLQLVLDELVAEGFLTTIRRTCLCGCNAPVYMRAKTV